MYPLTLALLTFVTLGYAMPVDNLIQRPRPNGLSREISAGFLPLNSSLFEYVKRSPSSNAGDLHLADIALEAMKKGRLRNPCGPGDTIIWSRRLFTIPELNLEGLNL